MRCPAPIVTLFVLLGAVGCHSEPFRPLNTGTRRPFDPGPPVRLTANTGTDDAISFTPDGAELLYTVNRSCAAFLPAHEARDSRLLCPRPLPGEVDGYSKAAVSKTQRLAFVLTRQRDFGGGPFYRALLVASLPGLGDTSEVIPVPFVTTVDGVLHKDITRLAWLRNDTLAILADGAVYITDPASTTRPRVFVRVSPPGTVYVMQQSIGGSVVYLRVLGDSRMLAWHLTGGGLTTVYDFANGNPGQVAVGLRHIAAVIPGAVVRINLRGHRTDTIPTYSLNIAELAMTPDGSDIIAAAQDAAAGGGQSDLYRLNP